MKLRCSIGHQAEIPPRNSITSKWGIRHSPGRAQCRNTQSSTPAIKPSHGRRVGHGDALAGGGGGTTSGGLGGMDGFRPQQDRSARARAGGASGGRGASGSSGRAVSAARGDAAARKSMIGGSGNTNNDARRRGQIGLLAIRTATAVGHRRFLAALQRRSHRRRRSKSDVAPRPLACSLPGRRANPRTKGPYRARSTEDSAG